ncbi:MAG: agmatine deiminase family protein [Paracoccus sp. (in: a-proteobacteria)]|uniref:agmatine deiminase family protein n=1 Tax=Paracoccus sp. TaxID=267 RepID=UPI0026E043B8|nr:agmatine deiminase family protein [Paracoccus sp. (in: a-proteobacteria)]MDO5632774.1 agmatine deiminase family protein [Paracoccus sp. (in: a-proteobacteria)]
MTRRNVVQLMAAAGLLPAVASPALAQDSARAAGFRYPEETEPHERTFMQWPVNRKVYDDPDFLYDLQDAIAEIASTIAAFEPVVLLAAAEQHRGIRKRISGKVELWDIPTDDLWCRDSGPSFVVDDKGGLAVTQFNFNGWGNKQAHENDGQIAARVAERLGLRVFNTSLVGEAGGVETDGHGTLIAHESSFINPNRNLGSKAEIERMLLDTMGAEKVIWAPGIVGADITDYHIDALARFVKPGQIVIQMGADIDPGDPWSAAAFETRDILAAATDAKGHKLELVVLPEPYDIRAEADDFVSSYVNYYVCNSAVIAAQFGDVEADEKAGAILADLYPDREIIMLDVDPVGEVGGGIHCATHEQPKV